jgi:hypothetical protein
MTIRNRVSLLVCALVGSAFFISCDDSGTQLAPFEPEVSNLTDSFQLQATGLTGVTTTIDYNWENTGVMANIDQSGVLTAGQAGIEIRDALGTVVYTGDLATTGSYQSVTGETGTWGIRLTTNDAEGNLNFRVQKP